MSQRIKSGLYLLAFVIAAVIYNNETNTDRTPQTVEMVSAAADELVGIEIID